MAFNVCPCLLDPISVVLVDFFSTFNRLASPLFLLRTHRDWTLGVRKDLTRVYDKTFDLHNHWVSELCPTPGTLTNWKIQLFGNWIRFCPQVNGRRHSVGSRRKSQPQSLDLALSKGSNRVGACFHSHEEGYRYNYRNVVFYTYLELRTMI
jgi:hypothetical protein